MSKVLLTGFELYGTTPDNPAQAVAEALDGAEIDGAMVVGRVVPSRWFECIDFVNAAIAEVEPEIVVMMGEYGGRSMVTVERIAQNLNDSARYGVADNAGRVLEDDLTAPDGPAAYYTTLPIRAMVRAMRQAGIPADISDTLGTLMCNHLMYGVLHHVSTNGLSPRVGWIHLPHLPSVAALDFNLGAPSMSAETSALGVLESIRAALTYEHDIDDPLPSRLLV